MTISSNWLKQLAGWLYLVTHTHTLLLTLLHSFSSRPAVEISGSELAKNTTIGLQTLGIVPQTVFLNGRETNSSSASRRSDTPRRIVSDKRLSHLSSNRNSGVGSFDHPGPYGDLRRKLAQLDGSVVSLNPPATANSPIISEADNGGLSSRPATSPHPASSIAGTDISRGFPGVPNRPSSPSAESLISNRTTAIHSGLRTSKRGIHVGDGRKAAPAVGTVNTIATATGVLEPAVKLRADLEHDQPSGRSSPMPMGGTVRRENKLRMPFPAPASTTYGMSLCVCKPWYIELIYYSKTVKSLRSRMYWNTFTRTTFAKGCMTLAQEYHMDLFGGANQFVLAFLLEMGAQSSAGRRRH